jgi:hypothetical protein
VWSDCQPAPDSMYHIRCHVPRSQGVDWSARKAGRHEQKIYASRIATLPSASEEGEQDFVQADLVKKTAPDNRRSRFRPADGPRSSFEGQVPGVDAVDGHRAIQGFRLIEAWQHVASTAVINIWYAGGLGFYKDPLLEPKKSQESDSLVAGDASGSV